MTLVLATDALGQPRGAPVRLPGSRRRRLSSVVARHRPPAGRPYLVSVHRRGEAGARYRPDDRSVRLRAAWPSTLVGPRDVVVITVLPLGGNGLAIGLAIASMALIAIAPYAAPVLAGAALFGAGAGAAAGGLATAIQVGLVVGGIALGYAAQAAKAAASKKAGAESYSISGGGNLPKPGARKPLLYGRRWSSPPLSQQDYFAIDGDANVLTKRMTLGLGKFQVHRIRVGESLFWTEDGGIQAPFSAQTGPQGAAIEVLYERPSRIAPGDIIPSPSVGGQEVPRPGGNPARTPWYRLAPQGVTVDAAQLNWTYPAIYRVSSSGTEKGVAAGVRFLGREIDPNTGTVIGPEFELWRSDEPNPAFIKTPLRRNAYFRLPKSGAYEVSAQNVYPEPAQGVTQENRVVWDAMFGFKDDTRIRPATTEIVLRMRAGKGLTQTAFADIQVEATRILPVWTGNAWVEQPTRKAVWAYCDLVRSGYGLAAPGQVDADKALHYAERLTKNDTFDGQLPEVSSFWQAASEILLPLRADPVKVGAVHSFVRDESRDEPRHILTRRQIVRDSGGATFRTKVEGGDVIVEFDRDGDPKRPDEARYSYGPPSRTPKRYRVNGITDGEHALKHATWLAAVAVFRGTERKVTTEWDGRLVSPGDHVLSDLWFLNGPAVHGVAAHRGTVLELDGTANLPDAWGHGAIRTRAGREWGILRLRGAGPRGVELHPDDVAALTAKTGLDLAEVLAGDTQDPTTLVVGELVELQETYVARSAIPSDADHVQIEMVRDDPRVWQLLDEAVVAPAPVNADGLAEPLAPEIAVLHARCVRIETGIEVVWGVSATRGARAFEAELSYDGGGSYGVLSPLGPASSGQAPLRQSEVPVTVRARAYGRTGLPGPWRLATFTTVAPIVDGDRVAIVRLPPIDYPGLAPAVRDKIDYVLTVESEANRKAADLLTRVLAAASVGDANTAKLVEESQARLDGDRAIASDLSAVVVRLRTAEAAVVTERTARADGDGVQASRTDAVIVQQDADRAAFVAEQTVRRTNDAATATSLTSLGTQVEANRSAIVTETKARSDADGALGERIDAVLATTASNTAAVNRLDTSVTNLRTAQATTNTDLYARTDFGTASGRFGFRVASGAAGVVARVEAILARQQGGQTTGAGFYLELLDNGQSRAVFDANAFYITANNATVPAFVFDGQTLTIPYLRVTQGLILPNGVSDKYVKAISGRDLGAAAPDNGWVEITETAFTISPDAQDGWALSWTVTTNIQVTANGSNATYQAVTLETAVGLNGNIYNGFATNSVSTGAGGGLANQNTKSTGLIGSSAMEIFPPGNTKVAVYYRLRGGTSCTGRIDFAQIKAVVIKR